MKTKFRNFQDFYGECDYLYAMYEPHFFLKGCDIITNFKGNEIDKGCWYCIVDLGNNVHTILAYDHTGETGEYPFVVYCDWSQQPNLWGTKNGEFAECREFTNIEEAFYFMVERPSKYHIRPGDSFVFICEKGEQDTVYDSDMGLGLIDSIKHINSDEYYKGRTWQVCQTKSYGINVMYQTTIL